MRPIKLTLCAFGPYGGVESIDFREATDAGLFGIYGPTGSGKSSIFSAIAFALFGEGAKEEQGIGTMRSDFAADALLTEVSLQFELGAKRYYVRRIPDQPRPKTRGEGQTMQSHAAWLFDVSSVAIDDVGPDCCGVPLAERKVGDVARLVEELLGYGVQQFRQIVLLPQGRFERFLVSNSKDRLEILRELFDVSLYRKLTEKLKLDAADIRREIEDGYRLNGQRLAAEGFASSDVQPDLRRAGGQGRRTRSDHDRRDPSQSTQDRRQPVKRGALPRRIGRTKGGLNSKLHAVCDGLGRPIILLLSEGQMSDYKGAFLLLDALPKASELLGDRGYDSNWFRAALIERGITPCIPPRSNRKVQIDYDTQLYKQRHKIENVFARIKDWRRIATRYDRCAHTFMSAICIAVTVCYWLDQ